MEEMFNKEYNEYATKTPRYVFEFMNDLKISLNKAKKYAKKLKREIAALYLAYKRNDVPWYAKIVIALVVGYALSPIDLIPDFIPVLGYLDDLIIVPLGITLAIKLIPKEILDECRLQADEILNKGKPKNWLVGTVIIILWLVIVLWIVLKIFRR